MLIVPEGALIWTVPGGTTVEYEWYVANMNDILPGDNGSVHVLTPVKCPYAEYIKLYKKEEFHGVFYVININPFIYN